MHIDGDEFQLYGRLEGGGRGDGLGLRHQMVAGAELRSEWNDGAGLQFDIETPPQVTFNGVQGFDRPRSFDAIPAVATTGLYLDDRLFRTLGSLGLELQAGLRLDLLHERGGPLSGVRDAMLQPRLNLQVAPAPWLRLRAGWGRTDGPRLRSAHRPRAVPLLHPGRSDPPQPGPPATRERHHEPALPSRGRAGGAPWSRPGAAGRARPRQQPSAVDGRGLPGARQGMTAARLSRSARPELGVPGPWPATRRS